MKWFLAIILLIIMYLAAPRIMGYDEANENPRAQNQMSENR